MWILVNEKTGQKYYVLPEKEKHVVSRSNGDLIIQKDSSISREHAFLHSKEERLTVVDAKSRYGTFVNDEVDKKSSPLPHNVPTLLKEGDRILFGLLGTAWKVEKLNFRCITSTFEPKDDIRTVLRKLGGTIVQNWDKNCTHLVMPDITVTTKLLQCLVAGLPIVTPDFFYQTLKNIEEKREAPKESDFIPVLKEQYLSKELISFKALEARSKLFAGKTFIFLRKKQFDKYGEIISLGGGVCECMERIKIAKSRLIEENVVPILFQVPPANQAQFSQSSQILEGLSEYVASKGRRFVPECEIGLAILHCSIGRYCNPKWQFRLLEPAAIPEPIDILAKESVPLSDISLEHLQHVEIPDSVSQMVTDSGDHDDRKNKTEAHFAIPNEEITESLNKKRKRTSNGGEENANKKQTVEENPNKRQAVKEKPVHELEADKENFEIPETPPTPPKDSESLPLFSGFISANKDVSPDASTSKANPANKAAPKRPIGLTLEEDDDDDDDQSGNARDLFKFGHSLAKRPRKQVSSSISTSSTSRRNTGGKQPIFAFDNTQSLNKSRVRRTQSNIEYPKPKTPAPLRKQTSIFTTTIQSINRDFFKPHQVSFLDGWLTNSFKEMDLKKEEIDQKDKPVKIKDEPPDDQTGYMDYKSNVWLNEIKGMIQIRVKSMNFPDCKPANQDAVDGSLFSQSLNSSRNFKAFVKKQNYKPQSKIIPTKAVCAFDDSQQDSFAQ